MHWINPDFLPPVASEVERFLFNPRGQADGVILANGLVAHFPPHLSEEVQAKVKRGDRVTLYGVRPRATDLIACVAIDTARGERIVDKGPPPKSKPKTYGKKHDAHRPTEDRAQPIETTGTVERLLHGPKGEIRGVLLEQGAIVRFAPHVADALAHLFLPGAQLAVRGVGVQTDCATVIDARELGSSMRVVKRIPPKPGAPA
jgi:hypothetical protein